MDIIITRESIEHFKEDTRSVESLQTFVLPEGREGTRKISKTQMTTIGKQNLHL